MSFLVRPLPRWVTRPISAVVLATWAVVMALLVQRSYLEASGNLATDLARYGSSAQWRGVYYRGEKLGFTVSQTVPLDDGFELQEDGQLQMTLLGAHTFTRLQTRARVNRAFELQSFDFALDPGTGPIVVRGTVRSSELVLSVTSAGRTRTEVRTLAEPPSLTLNLVRRLADKGLVPGQRHQWSVFDPATMRNAPVTIQVREREVVRAAGASIPAFRVDMEFSGLQTTSWITDTGEIVREESPLGFLTVRESADRAQALAVPGEVRRDLLEAAAVVPEIVERNPPLPPIDDPRDVRRLRLRIEGADPSSLDLQGVGQDVSGDEIEIVDAETIAASGVEADLERYLRPEPLIESDDPAILAAATEAVGNASGDRSRAEALTRHVNALLQKKPTVSLPSAREVLRTRVGDCNEHTALFVAMSRAIGIPARIAVGLTHVRGAFYYHAWPEVYIRETGSRGRWLPVDPTFNQFPSDATHVRLARGGLEKQAAIVPLIGRLKLTILELEVTPGSTPVLVGQAGGGPIPPPVFNPDGSRAANTGPVRSWCLPCFLGGRE